MRHSPVGVAHEDHLLHELAVGQVLGHDLPEDEQELLDLVVGDGHHEAYDGHEQRRILLAVEHQLDGLLERLGLHLVVALLQVFAQLHLARLLHILRQVDQRVARLLDHA